MWPVWVGAPSADWDARQFDRAPWRTLQARARAAAEMRPFGAFRLILFATALIYMFYGGAYLGWRLRYEHLDIKPASHNSSSALHWLLVAQPGSWAHRLARSALLAVMLAMVAVPSLVALEPLFIALELDSKHLDLSQDPARSAEVFALIVSLLVLVPATLDACFQLLPARLRRALALSSTRYFWSAALVLVVAFAWRGTRSHAWLDQLNRLLFSLRGTHLESGLTPLSPLFLFGAALLILSGALVRRMQLLERFDAVNPLQDCPRLSDETPASEASTLQATISAHVDTLRAQLSPWTQLGLRAKHSNPRYAAVFLTLVVTPALWLAFTLSFPLDAAHWQWAFWAGAFAVTATIALSTFGFLSIWAATRQLMRGLASSPLRAAFARLPERYAKTIGLEPSARPVLVSDLQYARDQLVLLNDWLQPRRTKTAFAPHCATLPDALKHALDVLTRTVGSELRAAAKTGVHRPAMLSETQQHLARVVACLLPELAGAWRKVGIKSSAATAGSASARPDVNDTLERARLGLASADEHHWYALAEEFIAVQVITFLSYVFVCLRASLLRTTLGLVLLLLAVTTYPFEPQVPVLTYFTLLIAAVVVSGVVTFLQASRSELLSLIQRTTPNKVSWDGKLGMQLATYVGVPVLAVTAAQLPVLGRLVTTLLSTLAAR